MNLNFIKFCGVLFLEEERQTGMRKGKGKKFYCLVIYVRPRKNFEFSPGIEPNTFKFLARTLNHYKYTGSYQNKAYYEISSLNNYNTC